MDVPAADPVPTAVEAPAAAASDVPAAEATAEATADAMAAALAVPAEVATAEATAAPMAEADALADDVPTATVIDSPTPDAVEVPADAPSAVGLGDSDRTPSARSKISRMAWAHASALRPRSTLDRSERPTAASAAVPHRRRARSLAACKSKTGRDSPRAAVVGTKRQSSARIGAM